MMLGQETGTSFELCHMFIPEALKYWVVVQQGQSYIMGPSCLFSVGWRPF